MFTNLISHDAAKQVRKMARESKVNLVCSHKCSVSVARDCIFELKNKQCGDEYNIGSGNVYRNRLCGGCPGNCCCG